MVSTPTTRVLIPTDLPDLPPVELEAMAVQHAMRRQAEAGIAVDLSLANRDRLTVNWLRHERTGYDRDQTPVAYVEVMVRIAGRYPHLAAEVARQLWRRPYSTNEPDLRVAGGCQRIRRHERFISAP